MDRVFLMVFGESGAALGETAKDAIFSLAHCRITAQLQAGCILNRADNSIVSIIVDSEYS